jgi:hypothetical protein
VKGVTGKEQMQTFCEEMEALIGGDATAARWAPALNLLTTGHARLRVSNWLAMQPGATVTDLATMLREYFGCATPDEELAEACFDPSMPCYCCEKFLSLGRASSLSDSALNRQFISKIPDAAVWDTVLAHARLQTRGIPWDELVRVFAEECREVYKPRASTSGGDQQRLGAVSTRCAEEATRLGPPQGPTLIGCGVRPQVQLTKVKCGRETAAGSAHHRAPAHAGRSRAVGR